MTWLRISVLGAFIAAALALAGCNTMRGMGEDVSAAGGAVSGAASDTEEAMTDEEEAETN